MKRGKLMLTVLVVLAMLFASCSSHLKEGDAEGGSSAKTVRVSLGVDVEDGVAVGVDRHHVAVLCGSPPEDSRLAETDET